MIVQPPEPGEPACAITLAEHQGLAAQLAAGFGNPGFDPLTPRDEMHFAVAHHDSGWEEIDRAPPGDPVSGLPCSLGQHPLPLLLAAAGRSVALNEARHPYCGLLVSMHQAGLYNGRYGLNPAQPARTQSTDERSQVDAFLEREAARQARLRRVLRADPAWCHAAGDSAVFANYLRLQFFDRLALYLNLGGPGRLRPAVIDRVPAAIGRELDISIMPAGDCITLDPYPFCDEITVSYSGRSVAPEAGVVNWPKRLTAAPTETRRFHLRRKII